MLHFLACWHFFFFQVDRFPKGELESQNVHTHAYFNRYCWTAFPKGSNKSESCRSQRHFLHTTWAFRSKLWAQHMWSTGGLRQGPGLDSSHETSVFKEKEKEHWVKRHEFLSISSSPIPDFNVWNSHLQLHKPRDSKEEWGRKPCPGFVGCTDDYLEHTEEHSHVP